MLKKNPVVQPVIILHIQYAAVAMGVEVSIKQLLKFIRELEEGLKWMSFVLIWCFETIEESDAFISTLCKSISAFTAVDLSTVPLQDLARRSNRFRGLLCYDQI